MESIESELELLRMIIDLIGEEFGEQCEVVLHDWSKGYGSSILEIKNGHVTGRKLGDSGSNMGLPIFRSPQKVDEFHKYNYITQAKNGRILRSSTIYLKNNQGKAIGALCINYDITDLLSAQSALNCLTKTSNGEQEYFVNTVSELLDCILAECVKALGKPVEEMTKEDKRKAIKYLDERGAFMIMKSTTKICKYLKISKYTLYNYLNELRDELEPDAEPSLENPSV
jgi:predicted transcriptional regulator YheO